MFMGKLKQLTQLAATHSALFRSAGFTRFFAMIGQELDEAYFAEVRDHLKALQFRHGVLISAALGAGNKGTDYVLRRPAAPQRSWLESLLPHRQDGYRFCIAPRDESGATRPR